MARMSEKHDAARRRYRPDPIRVLLIAEAPPCKRERFFYFEDVPVQDSLFLQVMQVLYPQQKQAYLAGGREPEDKRALLERFRDDGFYLEDLHEEPTSVSTLSDAEAAAGLVTRLDGLDPATPIVLIKASVYDAAAPVLRDAGFDRVMPQRLPFPGSGNQGKFRVGFAEALEDLGLIVG